MHMVTSAGFASGHTPLYVLLGMSRTSTGGAFLDWALTKVATKVFTPSSLKVCRAVWTFV